jgi:hypothetical protein
MNYQVNVDTLGVVNPKTNEYYKKNEVVSEEELADPDWLVSIGSISPCQEVVSKVEEDNNESGSQGEVSPDKKKKK